MDIFTRSQDDDFSQYFETPSSNRTIINMVIFSGNILKLNAVGYGVGSIFWRFINPKTFEQVYLPPC